MALYTVYCDRETNRPMIESTVNIQNTSLARTIALRESGTEAHISTKTIIYHWAGVEHDGDQLFSSQSCLDGFGQLHQVVDFWYPTAVSARTSTLEGPSTRNASKPNSERR